MAKHKSDIDKTLKDLYSKAFEFNDKLHVAREMVKLEVARLKQEDDPGNDVPTGLQDDK